MRQADLDAFAALWNDLTDAGLEAAVDAFTRERFAAERAGCWQAE
jgi:hypothetical protein